MSVSSIPNPASPGYPAIDTSLLPGVPNQRGPQGPTGTTVTGFPQNLVSASYTLALTDAGKHVYVTVTGQTITVPDNGTVAFPIGSTVVVINAAAVSTSIAITTGALYLAGVGTAGTRTLAAFGIATLLKVTATTWLVSGNGLT